MGRWATAENPAHRLAHGAVRRQPKRALLERGDADISYELPNKDFVELKDAGKLTCISWNSI
jgi:hypothetical protein